MENQYLLLWLEAPLQSWGYDSRFDRRGTLNFPTRSGILGIICSALGARGEQKEFLLEMSDLKQTVLSFVKKDIIENKLLNKKMHKTPLLRDFQMVGSGYNNKDPWEKLLIPKTKEGKPAVGGGSKMTFRYYLQDAAFAVIVEVREKHKDSISNALKNPVWSIFLGRKNCIPSDYIFRNSFASAQEAETEAFKIAELKNKAEEFRVVDYSSKIEDNGEIIILNDVPLTFGENKIYKNRKVLRIYAG